MVTPGRHPVSAAVRVVEELRDWYERDVRPAADACEHSRTFVAGPHRVCRECGTTGQDAPVERPRRAQDAHPDTADGPTFGQEYARAAPRRRVDSGAEYTRPVPR